MFFFLLLSVPSSVLQWHHEEGNFFSEYDQCNWLFYVRYYLEVPSSRLYVLRVFDMRIWIESIQYNDYWRALVEWTIGSVGSISHEIGWLV